MAAGRVRIEERQHLIIDADDTLWENNIYFERAFEDFCDFLAHSSLSPPEVRGVLDEIEIVNSKIHGYGTANFGRNLTECYHRLVEREVGERDLPRIMSFTEQILHHPIELIAGVDGADVLAISDGQFRMMRSIWGLSGVVADARCGGNAG